MTEVDQRRLVGIKAERVTNISSTDYPGHYPNEDHSWNLESFTKVRFLGWIWPTTLLMVA